jgi:hypothetical protein
LKCRRNPSPRDIPSFEDLGGIPIIIVFNQEKSKGKEFSSINPKAKNEHHFGTLCTSLGLKFLISFLNKITTL